ncbi:MAG: DUF3168 domain-containing protein [Chloroflexi bacterium]|nr:DUF3168 domain-containing protein [Chloroflexota bacterium]
MTTIEEGIAARMTGFSGLSALVAARVYPVRLPQGATLPAVTYQRVSGQRTHTVGGRSNLARHRYQMSCWADSHKVAAAVAEQVRLCWDGFVGVIGTSPGLSVQALVDNDQDMDDPETQTYHIPVDVLIWYEENNP